MTQAPRFAILAPRLDPHDATTNDALAMARLLRDRGLEAELFAEGWNIKERVHHVRTLGSYLKHDSDVLIYHYAVAWERALRLFRTLPCRKILRYHNVTPARFFEPYHAGIAESCRAGREMLKEFVKEAHGFWADSRYNAEDLLERGASPELCHVFAPFPDMRDLLSADPDEEVLRHFACSFVRRSPPFLMVGRIVPNKGYESLLRSFALYRRRYDPMGRLILLGRKMEPLAGYYAKLDAVIREEGLEGSVFFLDQADTKALKAAYLSAGALVVMSEHEGFCVPLVEAMALRVPLLVYGGSAVGETAGEAALVWESPDPELFAASMDRIVQDRGLATEMGRLGYERYRTRFSEEAIAAGFLKALGPFVPGLDGASGTGRSGIVAEFSEDDGERVALVVQRWHPELTGGSESHAWQYAQMLKERYCVDLLTTTALETGDWSETLQPGEEHHEGVRILRFPVTVGRTAGWRRLHDLLVRFLTALRREEEGRTTHLPWTPALQEEWIRTQGPHSEPLLEYLRENGGRYRAVLFITYLYSPAYFGMELVDREKILFVPTLHDEPASALSCFAERARRARALLWNTEAERRLGERLWGSLPGGLAGVGVAVDESPCFERTSDDPYLLYCGRIDPGKGCDELLEFFLRFKARNPSSLALVLTGHSEMRLPSRGDVRFEGFVDEERKRSLMRGALAFVMPSPNESLSIVTLESLAVCTPVIATAKSEVLKDHMEASGGGYLYETYEEFEASVLNLAKDPLSRKEMGMRGRLYVKENYAPGTVLDRLTRFVEGDGTPGS